MRLHLALAVPVLALPLLGMGALAVAQTWPTPRSAVVPLQGLYIGAAAGMNFRHEAKFDSSGVVFTARPSEPGFAGLIALGYGLGNGLRFEIEGNVRQNNVRSVGVAGFSIPGAGGDLRSWGLMLNGFADLNLGTAVTPYVGVGLGIAINDWKGVGAAGTIQGVPYRLRANGTDPTFAYQAIAGLSYDLASITPGLSATAEYRFFGTLNPSLNSSLSIGELSASGRLNPGNNYNHSILVGLRYSLATPPRPAIPFNVPPARR